MLLIDFYFKFCIGSFCLGERFFNSVGRCKDYTDTAMSYDFRFSEDADLNTWLFNHLLKIAELILLGISFYDDSL